jgi:hypothetical protein
MSIDYSTSVFVGFKVKEEDIFDIRHTEKKSCSHITGEEIDIKFCPICGIKVGASKYTETKFKLELQEIMKGVEVYDVELWSGKINQHKITLYHLCQNYGSAPYMVGAILKHIDPKYSETDAYFCGKPDDILKETELVELLTTNDIPFEKDTFGIYLLNEVF